MKIMTDAMAVVVITANAIEFIQPKPWHGKGKYDYLLPLANIVFAAGILIGVLP